MYTVNLLVIVLPGLYDIINCILRYPVRYVCNIADYLLNISIKVDSHHTYIYINSCPPWYQVAL